MSSDPSTDRLQSTENLTASNSNDSEHDADNSTGNSANQSSSRSPDDQTKPNGEPNQPQKSPGWVRQQLEENVPTILVAVLLAFGVRIFVAEPRYIPSSSMEPTLQINDRLLIEKISYRFRDPQRGEVIVFYPPDQPAVPDSSKVYIKRVIGVPGDEVAIKDGQTFINDQPIAEPYIKEPMDYTLPYAANQSCDSCVDLGEIDLVNEADGEIRFTIPPGNYWVMGDNRNRSLDSHAWGYLPAKNVVGRAFFRYWPIDNRAGTLKKPTYSNLEQSAAAE
ncbi:signal peptidase I [Thalassoporum mexicanum PCC 7367]|uniref:signal peptidase I n=1 Tax=Thalassoporum mexicanum TaxID=3457544 RepID=UPI00029F964F|nr:signal peptidase I [Pseudanabaena sp. PCC 7367]AFY68824.1 signal peptidase I [Pseudanabaena sp. PCC 7367]